jgi:hypothetical protein
MRSAAVGIGDRCILGARETQHVSDEALTFIAKN